MDAIRTAVDSSTVAHRRPAISAYPPAHQAVGLPSGSIELPVLGEKLVTPNQYGSWKWNVHTVLFQRGLLSLIRRSIPRPNLDDLDRDRWTQLSEQVGLWLLSEISNAMLEKIRTSLPGETSILADDVWERIEERCELDVMFHDIKALRDFAQLSLTSFSDPGSYLDTALSDEFVMFPDRMFGFQPFVMALMILQEIETRHPTVATPIIMYMTRVLTSDNKFTFGDFHLVIQEIRVRLQEQTAEKGDEAEPSSTAPVSMPDTSLLPLLQQRHRPLFGVSDEENRQQKLLMPDDHSFCGYCGLFKHRASECWALRPDLRPPSYGQGPVYLWVYKRGENNGRPRKPRYKPRHLKQENTVSPIVPTEGTGSLTSSVRPRLGLPVRSLSCMASLDGHNSNDNDNETGLSQSPVAG